MSKHEKHLRVGDFDFFTESMKKSGVERSAPQQNPIGVELYGLQIIESKLMPKDRAMLVDADGTVLQIYDL